MPRPRYQAELSACGPPPADAVPPLCPCPPDETRSRSRLHAQAENPVGASYARDRTPGSRTIRETRQVTSHTHRVHAQQKHDKNKVYSVHEPEVECIAKGKAGKQYEFGNKVNVAVSSRGGWFVGAKSFTGNPYDGHTLAAQMKQVENIIGTRSARRT